MVGARRRDGRRREQRRAKYFVLHEEINQAYSTEVDMVELTSNLHRQRKPLSDTDAWELFDAIRKNKAGNFGIIRMMDLQLDSMHDTPALQDGNQGHFGYLTRNTLLSYAISFGRDKITSQLLRAGANAALCMGEQCDERLAAAVRLRMMQIPGAYRTYLVKMYAFFHRNFACSSIDDVTTAEINRTTCDCGCGKAPTLLLQPCGHHISGTCYWESVLRCTQDCKHNSTSCPCSECDCTELDIPGDIGSPTVQSIVSLTLLQEKVICETNAHVVDAASSIALRSLNIWNSLPESAAAAAAAAAAAQAAENNSEQSVKLRPSHKGSFHLPSGELNMSFRLPCANASVASLFCLRHTKEQRTEELHRAVNEGYTQRVLELVHVGCDINAADSCGVSPLSTAAFLGHFDTVKALILCGAKIQSLDRLQRSVLDIANSARRKDIVELLLQYGAQPSACRWDFDCTRGWKPDGRLTGLVETSVNNACLEKSEASSSLTPWRAEDAFIIDNAFSEEFLAHLGNVFDIALSDHVQTGCRGNTVNNAGAAEFAKESQSTTMISDLTDTAKAAAIDNGLTPDEARIYSAFEQSQKFAFSDRAMFSDMNGECVVRTIREVLHHYTKGYSRNGDPVSHTCTNILPYMRFIRYRMDGACSPPHVDLVKSGVAMEYPLQSSGNAGVISNIEGTEEPVPLSGVIRSTHTFILYMTTCETGGETALLRKIPPVPKPITDKGKSKIKSKEAGTHKSSKDGEMGTNHPVVESKEKEQPSVESPRSPVDTSVDTSVSTVPAEMENTIYAVQPVRGRLLFFPHNHPHTGRSVVLPKGLGTQKLILRGEMF